MPSNIQRYNQAYLFDNSGFQKANRVLLCYEEFIWKTWAYVQRNNQVDFKSSKEQAGV